MSFRKETLAEGCEVYLGDCREVLPTLGRFDAVVTDPPYGIGADRGAANRGGLQHGKSLAPSAEYDLKDWDCKPIPPELMSLVTNSAKWCIIFGGNFYSFPASSCWLVWDKENGDNGYADCELAWTNLPKAVRRIKWMWHGMLRRNGEAREGHPTQKPVEVMRWAIGQLPEPSASILDPFMGSGTTGMAAVKAGKQFTGIEIDPTYFDLACERITRALREPDLFIAPPKPIEQTSMFSEESA
jgi:DNA modification methylase